MTRSHVRKSKYVYSLLFLSCCFHLIPLFLRYFNHDGNSNHNIITHKVYDDQPEEQKTIYIIIVVRVTYTPIAVSCSHAGIISMSLQFYILRSGKYQKKIFKIMILTIWCL